MSTATYSACHLTISDSEDDMDMKICGQNFCLISSSDEDDEADLLDSTSLNQNTSLK